MGCEIFICVRPAACDAAKRRGSCVGTKGMHAVWMSRTHGGSACSMLLVGCCSLQDGKHPRRTIFKMPHLINKLNARRYTVHTRSNFLSSPPVVYDAQQIDWTRKNKNSAHHMLPLHAPLLVAAAWPQSCVSGSARPPRARTQRQGPGVQRLPYQ